MKFTDRYFVVGKIKVYWWPIAWLAVAIALLAGYDIWLG